MDTYDRWDLIRAIREAINRYTGTDTPANSDMADYIMREIEWMLKDYKEYGENSE